MVTRTTEDPDERSASVLAQYETMAAQSRAMLVAARESDWDEVVRLERDCARIVGDLKARGEPPLTDVERKRKMEIIRAMLADDAEIRDLAQPWLAQLSKLISNTAARRNIDRAYG